MKWLGMIAVLAASLSLAAAPLKSARKRMQSLEDLLTGVRRIRAELAARLCPLRELLPLAAEGAGEEVSAFLKAAGEGLDELNRREFSEIWSAACRTRFSTLTEDDLRALEVLGRTIGRYELTDQLAACERYLSVAGDTLEELRRKFPERRRLSLALGAAGGCFLCLLIL